MLCLSHEKPTLSTENGIDKLAKQLETAKRLESEVVAARRDIENQIIDALGVEVEGSTTFKGDEYRITTTGKISRKVDADAVGRFLLDPVLSPVARTVFEFKPTIKTASFKESQKSESETVRDSMRLILEAIEERPAKPSVSVKKLEA